MQAEADYAYLLLYLASGLPPHPPPIELQKAMAEAGSRLGWAIWSSPVRRGRRRSSGEPERIFLATHDRRRDDDEANRLAEGILTLVEVYYGPLYEIPENQLFDPRGTLLAAPFCQTGTLQSPISCKYLTNEICEALDLAGHPHINESICTLYPIPTAVVARAIRLLPVYTCSKRISLACSFLTVAQEDFFVFPGDLEQAVREGNFVPKRLRATARWECAYQNAYKAVEALIGDPSNEERKLLMKLRETGVDPNAEVGFGRKKELVDVVREMNDVRDRRAAHGSTPIRGIELREMVEFQACARFLVTSAIEKEYRSCCL